MNPKVSVIIPTKDRPRFLSNAIRSVLDQSFNDFEIIIIDSSSSQDTKEIVNSFHDARIQYMFERKDKGVSASRNQGIRKSKGDFLAFLDDDDMWLPSKLERQLDLMRKEPDVGVVYAGSWKINENGKVIGFLSLPFLRGNVLSKLLEKNYIGGCSSVVVRKECLEKVGLFDERFSFGEDFELWVRLAENYEFDYVREPLVFYRIHEKRLTVSVDPRKRIEMNKLFFDKHSKALSGNRKALGAWHYSLGMLNCASGNFSEGKKEFGKAIFANPFYFHYYVRLLPTIFGLKVFWVISESLFTRTRRNIKQIHV